MDLFKDSSIAFKTTSLSRSPDKVVDPVKFRHDLTLDTNRFINKDRFKDHFFMSEGMMKDKCM